MQGQQVAARFFAFAYFLNHEKSMKPDQAGRYARRYWKHFLPYAGESLTDILAKKPDSSTPRKIPSWRKHHSRADAAAC
jgi:hypothetical protein